MARKVNWYVEADKVADRHKLPRRLFRALIGAESNWVSDVRSPAGAIGFTQLMPATAAGLGVDPTDPYQNLEGGARYLRQQMDAFGGNVRLALAAYNAGPGAVRRYGGVPPYKETQRYVRKIMQAAPTEAQAVQQKPGKQQTVTRPALTVPPPADLTAPSPLAGGGAEMAFENLGRIARGESPTKTLSSMVSSIMATPTPVRQKLPQPQSMPPAPTPAAPAKPVKGLKMPLATPLTGSSEFGVQDAEGAPAKDGRRYHAAKDWFAPAGAAVTAPQKGEIVEVKPSRGRSGQIFGGVVKVRLGDGKVVVFRHIDPAQVRVGDSVLPGEAIGRVTAWTGGSPHAHIEVWKTLAGGYTYENMLDPVTFFRSSG